MATDPRLARHVPRTATPQLPPQQCQQDTAVQDVADEKAQSESTNKEDGGYKLKFCTVCASNQNRSVYLGLRTSLGTVNGV